MGIANGQVERGTAVWGGEDHTLAADAVEVDKIQLMTLGVVQLQDDGVVIGCVDAGLVPAGEDPPGEGTFLDQGL